MVLPFAHKRAVIVTETERAHAAFRNTRPRQLSRFRPLRPARRRGSIAPSPQPAAPGSARSARHPAIPLPAHPRCRCPAWPATAWWPLAASCVRSLRAACAFSSAICCSASSSFRSRSRCRASPVASTVATIFATSPVIAAWRSSSQATVFSSRSAAACRRAADSISRPLSSSILSSLSHCACSCVQLGSACCQCLPCFTAGFRRAQTERRPPIRSLLTQQDRCARKGHLRQPPNRRPHVLHMGIRQLVAHAHLFGRVSCVTVSPPLENPARTGIPPLESRCSPLVSSRSPRP